MNNVGLVSVVIPVYGVEKYLAECLDSIARQTYPHLEVVLVDDESPDSCPTICDEYVQKDSRFHVIHKKNGGAASARNAGLDVITGKYVCLIDSDDTIEDTFVEKLLEKLFQYEADIAVCSFDNAYIGGALACDVEYPTEQVMPQTEYLKRFTTDWTSGIAWNKLFKSELLKDVRYAEGHKIDDESFTYKAVMNADKVVIFNEALYHYRLRKSSVMNSSNQERMFLDYIYYFQQRYEEIGAKFPRLKQMFFEKNLKDFASFWLQCKDMPQAKKQLKAWKRKNFFKLLFAKMSLRKKIHYIKVLCFCRAKALISQTNKESQYNLFD